jgi:hypothetical protein
MTGGENEPITASRRIGSPASVIFQILADPARHRDLDGSGMLRGWYPARGSPASVTSS